MAGNARRRGAVRKPGTKKGAAVGSGGQRRKALRGKGPTPKATERTGHPAARRAGPRQGAAADGRRGDGRRGGRAAATSEVVSGRNPVVEALRAGVPARALYVATRIDSDDRVKEAVRAATDRGIPLLEGTRTDLDRLAGDAGHQGLVLQVPGYEYAHPDDLLDVAADTGRAALLVALDGVTDPRNLGAVIRSVSAFGGHGVIVPGRRSAGVTAAAWKASAGAAARVPVARATNLARCLADLRGAGCFAVGLDAAGSMPLTDIDLLADPVVLVAGSEGKGLSRIVREACDVVVSIPIAAGTESLNASVAVGVALYEASRHRTRQGSSGLTSPGATPRTAASSGLSTSTPAT